MRFVLIQLNTKPVCDFFISFDDAAQALTETVFVELSTRIGIPQAATIGAEFIAQI